MQQKDFKSQVLHITMTLKNKDCVLRIGNFIHSKPFNLSNQAECTFCEFSLIQLNCLSPKIELSRVYSNKSEQLRKMKQILTFNLPGIFGYIAVCEEGRL